MKSVPEIRFPGFTDLWEERKLGNTVQITMGQSPNGGTYSDVPSDYILVQGNADLRNGWVFPRVWTSQMTKQADAGDLIMSVRAPAGAMGKTAYNVVIGRGVAAIKGNEFMYQLLVKMDSDGYWKTLSCGSTFESLNSNNIKNADVFIPDIAEQEKIGNYFFNLDNLITFQEQQCQALKDFKQCMLQKMFPKDGSDKPEIRFPGFTDSWEQRKLGDVVDRVTRKNQDLVSELPLTISAQYGLIDQNEFFDKRVASRDVSGYYLVENGEFAYNKSASNDAPWGAIKRLDRYANGVLSTLYIVFRIKNEEEINSDFLVSYYDTNLWYTGIYEIAAEGARNHGLLNIAPTDFFGTKLMLPQDIEEQKKIGDYFKQLDTFITFSEKKCKVLKKLKQCMFQKMFV